jgi:enterochelin esterase-like enzyme
MQALAIGIHHSETFAWIGVFSPIVENDLETRYAAQWADAAALNRKLALLWVGCGTEDNLFRGATMLDATLTAHGIKHEFQRSEGARHSWVLWRQYLEKLAPVLFR